MSTNVEALVNKEYQHGFVTDIILVWRRDTPTT